MIHDDYSCLAPQVRSSSEYMDFDAKHRLGFVRNKKRFNVALTRAKVNAGPSPYNRRLFSSISSIRTALVTLLWSCHREVSLTLQYHAWSAPAKVSVGACPQPSGAGPLLPHRSTVEFVWHHPFWHDCMDSSCIGVGVLPHKDRLCLQVLAA